MAAEKLMRVLDKLNRYRGEALRMASSSTDSRWSMRELISYTKKA